MAKQEKVETTPKRKKRWSFPTPSKCPRCQTIDTEAYSTRDKVQYRRCRRAICRHYYHVIGTPIKKKEIINEKKAGQTKT